MSRPDDKQKTGIIDYVLALILILIIALIFIQVFWRYVFNAANARWYVRTRLSA